MNIPCSPDAIYRAFFKHYDVLAIVNTVILHINNKIAILKERAKDEKVF